jgi:hypothetical protein
VRDLWLLRPHQSPSFHPETKSVHLLATLRLIIPSRLLSRQESTYAKVRASDGVGVDGIRASGLRGYQQLPSSFPGPGKEFRGGWEGEERIMNRM